MITKYNLFWNFVFSDPPQDDKYDTLKKAFLNRLTDTEESRFKKLLTDLELGDKHPSDLLRQRKNLTGNSISDLVIKSLWLQRFPQQTQPILSISKDSLGNIAEMADKIIAVYSTSEICPITKVDSSPTSIDRDKLEALQADIAALAKEFDEFSRNTRSRSKSREHGRLSKCKSNSTQCEFCWYHCKFGRNAKKCVQTCQFKKKN
ncbi:hypothetical protein AVEN_244307-1 [Araneus ventricosus]|uniref:CCHC-type domain-containing protein n=1 Tax=Araneus ventricosus TaxID=182803 RepID=A0A4Y2HR73_ARAVE|nr:hypothetical protein AVEN_244307-1 [Araneus ventricosus]